MLTRRCVLVALGCALACATAWANQLADQLWMLCQVSATGDSVLCILKVQDDMGQPKASVVFAPPNVEVTIEDFQKTEKHLSFKITQNRTIQGRAIKSVQTFEGTIGQDQQTILGNLGEERFASRAKLTRTDKTTLERQEMSVRHTPVDPYQKALQLNAKATTLMLQAQREQDAEKKKELQQQMQAARKEADEKVPQLYREVISQHSEKPEALDAALFLLRASARAKMTPEEATQLLKIVERHAAPYGNRFQRINRMQMAQVLINQAGMEPVVLTLVEPMVKELKADDKASAQVPLLSMYRKALTKANRPDELKSIDERLTVLEKKLDQEYLATVPPFKPAKYAGRQNKTAKRAVVMELFTGAQCPPCVAADVAFDALEKAYPEKDLILIQYHMHIPGPDPMTNLDCIARWDYYKQTYAQQIRGTPSTLFNGKPQAGGGGGMTAAENKFKQYTGIIDPLLEQDSTIRIQGEAKRSGDKLEMHVALSGIEPDHDQVKLRLLLVEESIRYVGSNNLRFHHHVVRAMPGGAGGMVIKDKTFKHAATLDLSDLRANLGKYLDEYAANTRPFPNEARPLDFHHLKVIAIVQHDGTKEILQAAYLPIQGQSAKQDH